MFLIKENLTLKLPVQIYNSPYCQLHNSSNVSSKNLVLDQLIILKFIFFFILITYLQIFNFLLIVAIYCVLIL